jgi:excisionase family DNA binding protein
MPFRHLESLEEVAMKLWLNVTEGAEYAGVCKDLIYDACAAGQIRHIRVGGRRAIRMKRESIDAWFERHAVGPQDGRRLLSWRLAQTRGRGSGHERRADRPATARASQN